MYEDIVTILTSTDAEFKRLKEKINQKAPQSEIDDQFERILLRVRYLRIYRVEGARRLKTKLKILEHSMDMTFLDKNKLTKWLKRFTIGLTLGRIENRLLTIRRNLVIAEKRQVPVRVISI